MERTIKGWWKKRGLELFFIRKFG